MRIHELSIPKKSIQYTIKLITEACSKSLSSITFNLVRGREGERERRASDINEIKCKVIIDKERKSREQAGK